MDIFIMRHGIAEDSSPGGDSQRQLTPEGIARIEEVAAALAILDVCPDRILSSPLVRARQTAEIISRSVSRRTELLGELSPGYQPDDVCGRLAKMEEVESVMLVGHQPNCSELVSYLLGGSSSFGVEFKKGGVSFIQTERLGPSRGTLVWHMPPKALRRIAGSGPQRGDPH
ncbi:MAG: phosphohistidine phosphatase SixA [Acidobacteria bacterium]|nr:phosphohistidine phosphatase SixA [Acidobacteriota bacterium]